MPGPDNFVLCTWLLCVFNISFSFHSFVICFLKDHSDLTAVLEALAHTKKSTAALIHTEMQRTVSDRQLDEV